MQKLIYFILFSTLFSTCKSKEKISSSATAPAADTILLASIDRTPCFGRCPTYKITVYQSGYVVYEGKQNVKNIGFFSTRLEKEKTDQIKNHIIQNKITDLDDKYVNPHIADFPSTYTEVNLNGKYKHIVNTDPEAPKPLIEFEKFLDSFFTDQTVWTPIKSKMKE